MKFFGNLRAQEPKVKGMRSYLVQGPLPGFYHYYPGVPAVVGVALGGRVNFCPAVWNMGLSADPPLFAVALSPKRFTHGLVLEAGRKLPPLHPSRPHPVPGERFGAGGG